MNVCLRLLYLGAGIVFGEAITERIGMTAALIIGVALVVVALCVSLVIALLPRGMS